MDPNNVSLTQVVTELLDLAGAKPPSAEQVKTAFAARATKVETGSSNLDYPKWAKGTRGGSDLFLTLQGDLAGIAIWEDSRGWGTYAELAVTRGTLAALRPIIGETRDVPRAPDDLHSGPKVAAYVERAGKTVRVFVELVAGGDNVQRVTVHFQN